MNNYCYSPLPPEEYKLISLPRCEVGEIIKLGGKESTAVWNLFWLSMPSLDPLPVYGKTARWALHYAPTPGAVGAITADAIADEALFRKLLLHPTRFAQFFEREDHSIYDTYEVLGDEWVETVLSRAAAAASRMAHEVPALARDNIYSIGGGKKAA